MIGSTISPKPWSKTPYGPNIVAADGFQVCLLSTSAVGTHQERIEATNAANASLIVAAPDLYEAAADALLVLQSFQDAMMSKLSIGNQIALRRTIDKLSDALRLAATGGQKDATSNG